LIAKAGEKVAPATIASKIAIELMLMEAIMRLALLEETMRPRSELSSSR
jgi:hypothetical protein